jgi:hypothetical protein
MISLEAIDGTQLNLLHLLGGLLILGTFVPGYLLPDRFGSDAGIAFVLAGMLGGSFILFAGVIQENEAKHEVVASWANERYGVEIPGDQYDTLIGGSIATLEDGTEVQLQLPSKDAKGYLLYNVADRSEIVPQ